MMLEAGCRSMTRASPRSCTLLKRDSFACRSLVSCCNRHTSSTLQPHHRTLTTYAGQCYNTLTGQWSTVLPRPGWIRVTQSVQNPVLPNFKFQYSHLRQSQIVHLSEASLRTTVKMRLINRLTYLFTCYCLQCAAPFTVDYN